jgi:methyl-accepting chemotaxis protein
MTNLSIRFKLLIGSALAILASLGIVIYLALSAYQTSIHRAVKDTTDIITDNVNNQLHLTADQITGHLEKPGLYVAERAELTARLQF